jgi:hypothetical protein
MVHSQQLAALLLAISTVSARSVVPRAPVRRQSFDFINATQYNGTGSEPVEISIDLGAGGRNQTSPLLYGW